MIHLNYFVALVAIGAFFLSLTVGFVVTQIVDLVALLVDAKYQAETVANLTYSSITVVWSLLVAGHWARHRGLSPPLMTLNRMPKLSLLGHASLLAGHALIISTLFIKDFGFLLLLPLIAVLALYLLGVLSLEVSRIQQRSSNGA